MEIIKTTGLTKTYQNNTLKVEAVKQVDLSISEGEFTAIVGPSGSGKTTLFNMIGGLDDITAGNVEIAGTNISNLKENQLIDFRLKHWFCFSGLQPYSSSNSKRKCGFYYASARAVGKRTHAKK